jgi:hypothetical protein
MSDPTGGIGPNPTGDWRAQRDAERAARRGPPGDGWFGIPLVGIVVVAIGVIFLARNFGFYFPMPDRWWAIFVLIPAGAALVSAARLFRVDGGLSSRVIGAATVGVLMLVVALVLFLDLEWDQVWPVMIIIVGLGIIARGYRRRS